MFNEIAVGGNLTIMTGMNGHIMQSQNSEQPQLVPGLEDNQSHSLHVGDNFAFVIGKNPDLANNSQMMSPSPQANYVREDREDALLSEPDFNKQLKLESASMP